jgi:ATP-dependent Zn protease
MTSIRTTQTTENALIKPTGEQDPSNSATNERAAYHEAGHAIAKLSHEIELDRVAIVPEGGALGYVEHSVSGEPGLDEDREKLEAQALVALAGPACEAHHFGRGREVDWNDDDYQHDAKAARGSLYSLSAHDDERAAYFNWIAERAMSFVSMPSMVKAADALAGALVEQRELTGEQAFELVYATWKSMRS